MSRTKLHSVRPQRRQINWFVIIMAVLFLLAAFKLGEQALTYHDLSQDKVQAEARLKAAQEENEQLQEEKDKNTKLEMQLNEMSKTKANPRGDFVQIVEALNKQVEGIE